jgi:hypothetical protein
VLGAGGRQGPRILSSSTCPEHRMTVVPSAAPINSAHCPSSDHVGGSIALAFRVVRRVRDLRNPVWRNLSRKVAPPRFAPAVQAKQLVWSVVPRGDLLGLSLVARESHPAWPGAHPPRITRKSATQLPTHERTLGAWNEIFCENICSVIKEMARAVWFGTRRADRTPVAGRRSPQGQAAVIPSCAERRMDRYVGKPAQVPRSSSPRHVAKRHNSVRPEISLSRCIN